jgi:hypothetical protein
VIAARRATLDLLGARKTRAGHFLVIMRPVTKAPTATDVVHHFLSVPSLSSSLDRSARPMEEGIRTSTD